MVTKNFSDKKIIIRQLQKSDVKIAYMFKDFINSLVEEDVKLIMNKKATLDEEKEWLKGMLKAVKNKDRVYLLAECDKKIAGTASAALEKYRKNHIAIFGIAIAKDYRGAGLGEYLMSEIIKLSKKELKPKPKIFQLEVYSNNKPAINLYKKMGLKIVAKIPKQIQYKGKLITELIMMLEI